MATDEPADYWRSGCECNRAGLCYRCRAAAEIERLRNDIRELTCGDPRLVCPNCRPDKQSVPACGELSVWGGTEILSCGLPAGHSGHHEFS